MLLVEKTLREGELWKRFAIALARYQARTCEHGDYPYCCFPFPREPVLSSVEAEYEELRDAYQALYDAGLV